MISSFLKIPGGTKSHQFPTKGASARNKAGKAPQHSSKKALDFWNNLHFCSLPIISPSFKQKKRPSCTIPTIRVGKLGHLPKSSPPSQGGGVEDSGAAKEREWPESFGSQGGPGGNFFPKESDGPTLEGWFPTMGVESINPCSFRPGVRNIWIWKRRVGMGENFYCQVDVGAIFFQLGGIGRVVWVFFLGRVGWSEGTGKVEMLFMGRNSWIVGEVWLNILQAPVLIAKITALHSGIFTPYLHVFAISTAS